MSVKKKIGEFILGKSRMVGCSGIDGNGRKISEFISIKTKRRKLWVSFLFLIRYYKIPRITKLTTRDCNSEADNGRR